MYFVHLLMAPLGCEVLLQEQLLIRQHGNTVAKDIQSVENEGSTFSIVF